MLDVHSGVMYHNILLRTYIVKYKTRQYLDLTFRVGTQIVLYEYTTPDYFYYNAVKAKSANKTLASGNKFCILHTTQF